MESTSDDMKFKIKCGHWYFEEYLVMSIRQEIICTIYYCAFSAVLSLLVVT